jgi:hypothetical protein
MTGWIVVGCILLALVLLGQLRVGAAAAYSEDGFLLKLKVGPASIQLLPPKAKTKERSPKPEKKPKKHPAQEGAKAEKPKKKGNTLTLALRFIPLVTKAAGRLLRKIRIDRLELSVVWGADDPAAAAQGYGLAHAALATLWPPIDHAFQVKEHDLRVDVDFQRQGPTFRVRAQATLTIGQILGLALGLGFQALRIYLSFRQEQKEQTEKAVQA